MKRVAEDKGFKAEVLKLLKIADVGIENLVIHENEIASQVVAEEILKIMGGKNRENHETETAFTDLKKSKLFTVHTRFDSDGARVKPATMEFSGESQGTRKLFALSGPFLDALESGHILIVDELDARFHPMLTRMLIGMFNSAEINGKNAQLIFVTHDTSQLDRDIFRRDQIWFTEKNQEGATSLYPLSDYRVRNDAPFEKDYMQGKYGAVPFIGRLDRIPEG